MSKKDEITAWWPTHTDVCVHLQWLTAMKEAWTKHVAEELMRLQVQVNDLQDRVSELEED